MPHKVQFPLTSAVLCKDDKKPTIFDENAIQIFVHFSNSYLLMLGLFESFLGSVI